MPRTPRSSRYQPSSASTRSSIRARPTLAERRAAALGRRQATARRRVLGSIAAVLLVAAGVGACTTISHVIKGSGGSGGSGPSSTTMPKPSGFDVGLWTFHWKDTTRDTPNLATGTLEPGRVVTTEVRYPTLKGSPGTARPGAKAAPGGPFPVIVFAHGFDVDPDVYSALLDAWVSAGFVVVSPIFPDENSETVSAAGGPFKDGANAEADDETNEPGDVAFALKQFAAATASGSSTPLTGLADLNDIALAGQSDGANVVGALGFGSAYASIWSSITPAPKAVAILSGQGIPDGPGNSGSNSYASGPTSPALLQVQSRADVCNLGRYAADLYDSIDTGPVHVFETLSGASHLAPYTGHQPWAAVVERVTTKFFELELDWHASGLSLSSVDAAGAVAGVSTMAPPTASTFSPTPAQATCSFPGWTNPAPASTTTTTSTVAAG